MKNSILLLSFTTLLLIFSSCNKEEGIGPTISQEIYLESIDGIELHNSANVFLIPSTVQRIVVESQANLIDNLERSISDGHWKIKNKNNVSGSFTMNIFIEIPILNYILLESSGNIDAEPFNNSGETIYCKNSGSGEIIMNQETSRYLEAQIYSSGSGEISFVADCSSYSITSSGSGNVNCSGEASTTEVELSGSGDFQGFSLQSEEVSAVVSGSGSAHVFSSYLFSANISGSGDIEVKGEPELRTEIITGSGRVYYYH